MCVLRKAGFMGLHVCGPACGKANSRLYISAGTLTMAILLTTHMAQLSCISQVGSTCNCSATYLLPLPSPLEGLVQLLLRA